MRSASVAGRGRRERKSAIPLADPLRYSSVYVFEERNPSQRWTRPLCSPTMAMFSSASWSE